MEGFTTAEARTLVNTLEPPPRRGDEDPSSTVSSPIFLSRTSSRSDAPPSPWSVSNDCTFALIVKCCV